MGQFLTDFSEYQAGTAPDDWRSGWVPGEQRFEVVDADGATGGKLLQHEVFAHNRRAWAWTKVPGAAEVEILTRLRSSSPDSRFGVIGRGGGTGVRDTEQGVTCELFSGRMRDLAADDLPKQELRQTLFLVSYNPDEEKNRGPKRPHGIGMIRGESHHPWTPQTWQWIRLQLREMDGYIASRARVWSDGQEEPGIWKYDLDHTEPATIGRQGFVGITGQVVAGVREYDVFSVGTDGDPAPTP